MNLLKLPKSDEWHLFCEKRSECVTSAAEQFDDECHFKVPFG